MSDPTINGVSEYLRGLRDGLRDGVFANMEFDVEEAGRVHDFLKTDESTTVAEEVPFTVPEAEYYMKEFLAPIGVPVAHRAPVYYPMDAMAPVPRRVNATPDAVREINKFCIDHGLPAGANLKPMKEAIWKRWERVGGDALFVDPRALEQLMEKNMIVDLDPSESPDVRHYALYDHNKKRFFMVKEPMIFYAQNETEPNFEGYWDRIEIRGPIALPQTNPTEIEQYAKERIIEQVNRFAKEPLHPFKWSMRPPVNAQHTAVFDITGQTILPEFPHPVPFEGADDSAQSIAPPQTSYAFVVPLKYEGQDPNEVGYGYVQKMDPYCGTGPHEYSNVVYFLTEQRLHQLRDVFFQQPPITWNDNPPINGKFCTKVPLGTDFLWQDRPVTPIQEDRIPEMPITPVMPPPTMPRYQIWIPDMSLEHPEVIENPNYGNVFCIYDETHGRWSNLMWVNPFVLHAE